MHKISLFRAAAALATVVAATSFATATSANPLNLFSVPLHRAEPAAPSTAMAYAPTRNPNIDAAVTEQRIPRSTIVPRRSASFMNDGDRSGCASTGWKPPS